MTLTSSHALERSKFYRGVSLTIMTAKTDNGKHSERKISLETRYPPSRTAEENQELITDVTQSKEKVVAYQNNEEKTHKSFIPLPSTLNQP